MLVWGLKPVCAQRRRLWKKPKRPEEHHQLLKPFFVGVYYRVSYRICKEPTKITVLVLEGRV